MRGSIGGKVVHLYRCSRQNHRPHGVWVFHHLPQALTCRHHLSYRRLLHVGGGSCHPRRGCRHHHLAPRQNHHCRRHRTPTAPAASFTCYFRACALENFWTSYDSVLSLISSGCGQGDGADIIAYTPPLFTPQVFNELESML